MTYEEKWVREKLGLSKDATLQDIQSELHVVCAHANGYVKYIETYKCEDKDGEIARLTTEIELLKLQQHNRPECECDIPMIVYGNKGAFCRVCHFPPRYE